MKLAVCFQYKSRFLDTERIKSVIVEHQGEIFDESSYFELERKLARDSEGYAVNILSITKLPIS